jgi:hypothetical protein
MRCLTVMRSQVGTALRNNSTGLRCSPNLAHRQQMLRHLFRFCPASIELGKD